MIPTKLEDWTYEAVQSLIDRNIGESDKHDFKNELPESFTLTKVCCAFANTKGGFIVVGIKEVNSRFVIEGITNDKELAHDFGQKIRASPTIDFDLPKIIPIPDSHKVLAVFHIPLSPERPHIPSQEDKRIFLKRTNQGNEHMTYEEIRMSFLNYEERREKLKLLYLELLSNIEQLKAMKIDRASDETSQIYYSLVTLDSTIISSLLTDLYTIIGKNKDLVTALFTIRENIKVTNNKTRIFFSQAALPLSNLPQLAKEHNEFINQKAEVLKPLIEKAIRILEEKFALKNPLLEQD